MVECRGNQVWAASAGLHLNPSLLWCEMIEAHGDVGDIDEAWVAFRPFDDADTCPTRGVVEPNRVELVV